MKRDAVMHPEYPIRMLGLSSITLDPDLQLRVKTDVAHARGITDFILKNGPIADPVIVFDDGNVFWLADGWHRWIAYQKAAIRNGRFSKIRAEVRPGTRDDAIVFAAAANKDTYTRLPRTKEDIDRAIMALAMLPGWIDKPAEELARHVGGGTKAVYAFWRRMAAEDRCHELKGLGLRRALKERARLDYEERRQARRGPDGLANHERERQRDAAASAVLEEIANGKWGRLQSWQEGRNAIAWDLNGLITDGSAIPPGSTVELHAAEPRRIYSDIVARLDRVQLLMLVGWLVDRCISQGEMTLTEDEEAASQGVVIKGLAARLSQSE